MRARALTAVSLGLFGAVALTAPVSAAGRADTTVTIEAESGGFFGYVESSKPALCANGRKVVLYKQLGDVQDPANDKRISSDIAGPNGDRYMWSTGNTGLRKGKFYARARKTEFCKPDSSPTIRAQQ